MIPSLNYNEQITGFMTNHKPCISTPFMLRRIITILDCIVKFFCIFIHFMNINKKSAFLFKKSVTDDKISIEI